MSQLTSQQFIEMLRRSQVLDDTKLAALLRSLKSWPADQVQDCTKLAARLVQEGVITAWHAQKLLAKKYKGFVLGKYLLLQHIGSGGMSHVYLAQHRLIGRQVALKVLPPGKVKSSSHIDRFIREAKAAGKLDHPNIVRAYDVDSHDDLHFIVMEYVDGIDLHKKVKQQGPLPFHEAASYIAQAARGLHHAHLAKLIHRDVKPSNLLVTPEGQVKVLDLGLAMFSDEGTNDSSALTNSNSVLGTADYLAPEQARDCHDVDYRADIYSLGCTLYYLLTGQPPFPGGTFAQRILKHQIDEPDPIQTLRTNCPSILSEACERMMKKAPEDRFQSAHEIDVLLIDWLKREKPAVKLQSGAGDHSRIKKGSGVSSPSESAAAGLTPEPQTGTNSQHLIDRNDVALVEPDAKISVEADSSVVERRKQATSGFSVKIPIVFWGIMAALAIVCIVLVVLVISQNAK
ncbi:MAG: serine/threonine protein kinase [Planctomycetales bacterium]|nr:serine/threonine protein kinase [Planctomycetales bacterium]